MTNSVYQTTVEELEALLSPRAVSRSLQEGLKVVGKDPNTIGYTDVEKILKAQIYRQLQVIMPVTEAKAKISTILERIKDLGDETPQDQPGTDLSAQEATITALKENLKPFNLYFEWPEVQKLRAQLQLLEAEHNAGREAQSLISEAQAQFKAVEQKLEDQLVGQAKALSELEASIEIVKSLGGPKVRRLAKLIAQVKSSQDNRQLAQGEIERARKLVTDLRKLLESGVVDPGTEPPTNPEPKSVPVESGEELQMSDVLDVEPDDASLELAEEGDGLVFGADELDDEVSNKLLMIDLESETQDLKSLEETHNNLLSFKPELLESIAGFKTQLEAQTSIADHIPSLREHFEQEAQKQRVLLQQELGQINEELGKISSDVDTAELNQRLQVNLSVLNTTLPPLRDIQHIKSLFTLAKERELELNRQRQAELEARKTKLAQQEQSLKRLMETLSSYQNHPETEDEFEALRLAVNALQPLHEAGELAPELASEARQAEHRLEAAIAKHAVAEVERERAQLRGLLADLQALPSIPVVTASAEDLWRTIEGHLAQLDTSTIGQESISKVKISLDTLKSQVRDHYQLQFSTLIVRAEKLGAKAIVSFLQKAGGGLDQGNYPDLEDIERSLVQATEVRRSEQMNDLRLLEDEASKFKGLNLTDYDRLTDMITEARTRIEEGELTSNIDDAWELLDEMQSSLDRRLSNFMPRLDEALMGYVGVAKLNSVEATELGRVLNHLDSQREAFGRISIGVRSELETSLQEAEELLETLKNQFEATQAVAGQLVSNNALDGLLGLFGDGPSSPMLDIAPEEPEETVAHVKSHNTEVDGWLDSYLAERGVRGIVVYKTEGDVLGGRLDVPHTEFFQAVSNLERDVRMAGEELELGKEVFIITEMARHALITAWPTPDHKVILVLDQPSMLSLILHKLRGDIHSLTDMLLAA